jgi:Tol biopolymer transport system component
MQPIQIQKLDVPNGFDIATQQNQPNSITSKSVVFIDTAVADYHTLMSGVEKGTQVILLHSEWDGIEQITTALEKQDDISTVHLVSHGSPGCLYLGNSCLSLKTLELYASLLERWFLKEKQRPGFAPSLLLYGCNVAATDIGTEFIAKLRQITGARIAASTTPTGNPALGGNWRLEVTTERMITTLAFPMTTQVAYSGVLNVSRVSVDQEGNQANNNSFMPVISASGRYVAFQSQASNLVAGDTNNVSDIFVYDRETRVTNRVSLGPGGIEGNNAVNGKPSISADGRYVAFDSFASNLVTGDTNNFRDIFVYDTQTNTTRRVSVNSQGNQGNSSSFSSAISADGRYVAFESYASNLVTGDTNNVNDIFVYDTQANTTSRVSVNSQGNQGNSSSFSPAISADGRYVAFDSLANNLVADDTNNTRDIFVYDTQTNTTRRVSVDSQGNQGNNVSFSPSISADGRYVTFNSSASNLVADDTNNTSDIFLYDTQTNTTSRVSVDSQGNQGNNASFSSAISADGRYVTFNSSASNLVADDTNETRDIFVYDTQTRITRRVSIDSQGNQGNNNSDNPSISADGSYVAFESYASNLVAEDTNDNRDIFVYDTTPTVSIAAIDASASESGDVGIFRINRFGDTSLPLEVTYNISGTATNGSDYSPTLTGVATIEPTQSFVDITITPVDDNLFVENDETLILTLVDAPNYNLDLFNTTATVTISNNGDDSTPPSPPTTTPELTKVAFDVFGIKGKNSSSQAQLSVQLTDYNSQLVKELGVFTVDDAQGRINGIAPGDAGYTEAALNRSQVIFSALANIPNGFDTNLTRKLAFESNSNLRFYLVNDSTTDAVLFDNSSFSQVVFPSTTNFKVESLDDGEFSLAWKDPFAQDGDFNDFVVKVEATDEELALGTSLQGKLENELIDLREVNTPVKADFILNREAAFDNFIGFYEIADDKGGIDTNGDGIVDLRPGDGGYVQAAVTGRVPGIDLTVNNQATNNFSATFQGGSLLAPFIIINSRPDALLDSNPNNDPQVYFPFLGANSDKADHVRLLGDNIFGFEDLFNGGDKDYNDMTVRINLSYA